MLYLIKTIIIYLLYTLSILSQTIPNTQQNSNSVFPTTPTTNLNPFSNLKPTSMDYELWDKTLNAIHSSKIEDRMWAIETILRFPDERGIDLLKVRFLIETENTILEKIFDILNKRIERGDYDTIIQFLKANFRTTLGVSCFKLLYKIKGSLVLNDLKKMMLSKKLQNYFLFYLEAVPNPTEEEKKKCHEIFHYFNLANTWMQFNKFKEEKIFLIIQPYYFDNFFTSHIQPTSLYWYLRYKTYFGLIIEPVYFQEINIHLLNSIPEDRHWIILQMARHILIDTIDPLIWYKEGNNLIKRWLLDIYLENKISLANLRNPSLWQEVAFLIIKNTEDPFLILKLNNYINILSTDEKNIYCSQINSKTKIVCFLGFIQFNPKQTISLWESFTNFEKEDCILSTNEDIFRLDYFQSQFFILWLFDNHKIEIRLKAISILPKSMFIKYATEIAIRYLFEKSIVVKSNLLYKITNDVEIYNLYNFIINK